VTRVDREPVEFALWSKRSSGPINCWNRIVSFGILFFLLVPCAAMAQAQEKPAPQEKPTAQEVLDMKEVRAFRLTVDNLSKYDAAARAIAKAIKDNPGIKDQMEDQTPDHPSIDSSVKELDKYPAIAEAIKNAGLSKRDYIVMTGTLMVTVLAVDMKRQGQLKTYPATISPENATFVEKNFDKVAAISQRAADAYKDQK
jgi:hypothetical protein